MNTGIIPEQKQKTIVKRVFILVLGLFLVVLLVWTINLGWHALHLYRLARDLQADPSQLQADRLLPLVEKAAHDVDTIHSELQPLFPIFNALEGLPAVGPYLGQVAPMLTYADGLSIAGREISLVLGPLLVSSQTEDTALTLPERASQVLQSGQAHFGTAIEGISQASQVRSRIRPEILPDSIRQLYLKLDGKFGLLEEGAQILQVAPLLVGAGESQSYLVLAQNRDELRATGGFISGIGLITIRDGKILQFNLGDSYAIDDFSRPYPKPPEALKRFMLADYWVTRDANWSPDFPSTALAAQDLYTVSTGIETQGVIAFNQLLLQRVLQVIGPVQVPGTAEPVTSENIEQFMRQAWAPAPEEGMSQEWWLHRKDFMLLLGGVILEKSLNIHDQGQLIQLAKTMIDLLDQGQVLLYFNDPPAQLALEKSGWDGALHPGGGDYLFLVDSNVGFNKVDSVVQRSLAYQVDLSEIIHPAGEATLTYQHTVSGDLKCKQEISYGEGAYQDMQQRCYLDYWRLYVPVGSELSTSTAQPIPGDELLNGVGWPGQVESLPGESGTQVFAGLLMLPMGQSTQINVSYNLPQGVIQVVDNETREYTLNIQVQPGLEGMPFQLAIKLPGNASPVNPGEGWKSIGDGTWSWQGVLVKSTQLHLAFKNNP